MKINYIFDIDRLKSFEKTSSCVSHFRTQVTNNVAEAKGRLTGFYKRSIMVS